MSGRSRYPREGFEPAAPPASDEYAEEMQRWSEEQALRAELAVFEARLIELRGLGKKTAETRSRTLAAMVRNAKVGTVEGLMNAPDRVVEQIRNTPTNTHRSQRHLVITDYLLICPNRLPEGTAAAVRQAITDSLPGRPTQRPNLIDIDLGGSRKEVRRRPPLSWDDGQRLIDCSGDRSTKGLRAQALVTLLVRSGLPPRRIRGLNWQDVLPLLDSDREVAMLRLDDDRWFAVQQQSIERLGHLWRDLGEPKSGPLFVSVRRPHQRLSDAQIVSIVRTALDQAGLPPIDRRQLRAPFARWLMTNRGWGEKAVAEALGFKRVASLRKFMRGVDEAAAQIRSTEAVVLNRPSPGRDEWPAEDSLRPRGLETEFATSAASR